jgi:hypothetical protein
VQERQFFDCEFDDANIKFEENFDDELSETEGNDQKDGESDVD